MKKIQELINLDLGKTLDTPKKLNRSKDSIPMEVIENLEAGQFTSEMIAQLGGSFPIFFYRTCITVHGSWPEVSISRIGQYKNVIQNGNGSIEIRYSAIDNSKIKAIRSALKGTDCPFHFEQNSSTRKFQWREQITKATFDQVRAKMEPIAKELAKLPIYGYVNLYIASLPFMGQFLVLDIHPLAIKETDVNSVVLALCGLTQEDYNLKREKYFIDCEVEEQRLAAEKMIADQKKQERTDLLKAQIKALELPISHLPKCDDISQGILIKAAYSRTESRVIYSYLKLTGNGGFGRKNWAAATSETLVEDTTTLNWVNRKQQSMNDLLTHIKGYSLLKPVVVEAAPVVRPTKVREALPTVNEPIEVIEYSAKSFALRGEATIKFKDQLVKFGSYNRFLKDSKGGVFKGWIFPLATKPSVEAIIFK